MRQTGSQSQLVRFACSLSASIDPDRPYKLSKEESRSLNELPVVQAQQAKVDERKQKWEDRRTRWERADRVHQAHFGHQEGRSPFECQRPMQEDPRSLQDRAMKAKRRFNKAVRDLRSKKQQLRNQRIRGNLERYKNEQPVVDLERQLAGKLVGTKVMRTLKHTEFMTREFMNVIDTMLTMPGDTIEAEYQRRINAINAVSAFCGVEEGRPVPRLTKSSRRLELDDNLSCPPTKRPRRSSGDTHDDILHQAMETVRVKSRANRPSICFLCVGNHTLSLKDRVAKYATSGSLTRHFLRKHVNPPWPLEGVTCNVCENVCLSQKSILLNHAENAHGTVVRGRAQGRLALQLNNTALVAACRH